MSEIKLSYNLDELKFHLKHIKKMCIENPECVGCPFLIIKSWAEYCMFAGISFDEGVNPEEWELDKINKGGL